MCANSAEEAALEAMETAAMMDRIWNLVLDHRGWRRLSR